jgi:hypothetical protein
LDPDNLGFSWGFSIILVFCLIFMGCSWGFSINGILLGFDGSWMVKNGLTWFDHLIHLKYGEPWLLVDYPGI